MRRIVPTRLGAEFIGAKAFRASARAPIRACLTPSNGLVRGRFGIATPAALLALALGAATGATACPAGAIAIAPGTSIQAAVRTADRGARFCLRPGVHRMQSAIPKAGQVFVGEPGSVLSGARPLAAFRREGRFWVADGQRPPVVPRGACRPGYACREPVGVFVDDARLRQAARPEDVEAKSFFLDRTSGRLYLAADPAGHRVEIAETQFAFVGSAPDVRYVGLTVEKYASPAAEGAIHGKAASGWRIERSELRLNTGAGIGLGPRGAAVDSNVHDNGHIGIAATGPDILIEGNTIRSNNALGYDPDWEAGGVKATVSDRIVFRRNVVRENDGPGLWCDIDCRDALFEDNVVESNADSGIFYEISYGARIVRNVVRNNGTRPQHWVWGAQIQIAGSERVEVAGNDVTVPPYGHGIMLIDQGRARDEGGLYKTRGNVVRDNTVRFAGPGRTGGTSDRPPGTENAGIIEAGGNAFSRNVYLAAGTPPRFLWGYDEMSFAAFQGRGQEAGGRMARGP